MTQTHPPDTEQARCRELRKLLQCSRSRLTREQAGLPPMLNHREGGLTQEDTAELLDMSVRRWSDFEHGRVLQPGASLLGTVADALHMEPGRRTAFYLLAAGHTPPPAAPAGELDPRLPALIQSMYPNPAFVTDCAWNVLVWNAAVAEWFTDPATLDDEHRNVMMWLFSDTSAKAIIGIEEERADMIGRLHVCYARYPGEPRLEAVVTRLLDEYPQARDLWELSHVEEDPVVQFRTLNHPLYGTVDVPSVTCDLPGGLRQVIFNPPLPPGHPPIPQVRFP